MFHNKHGYLVLNRKYVLYYLESLKVSLHSQGVVWL